MTVKTLPFPMPLPHKNPQGYNTNTHTHFYYLILFSTYFTSCSLPSSWSPLPTILLPSPFHFSSEWVWDPPGKIPAPPVPALALQVSEMLCASSSIEARQGSPTRIPCAGKQLLG